MPQSPGSSSSTGSPEVANDFGANEWLVEEMFDQFQKDPSSVDPAWAAFFAPYRTTACAAIHLIRAFISPPLVLSSYQILTRWSGSKYNPSPGRTSNAS